MTRINLLPWRFDRRKRREREFYMMLVTAAVVGVLAFLLWAMWMGARIDNQNGRNAYLKEQIKQLDVKIAEIKELEATRDRLLARKDIIEQLQANRSQMVHLFDELVTTIPDSARLTGLAQSGGNLHLEGVAQSNASVASYMRNLESSPWLGQTDLRKTENTGGTGSLPYVFLFDMKLTRPEDDKSATTDAETGASIVASPAAAAASTAPTAAATASAAPAAPATTEGTP